MRGEDGEYNEINQDICIGGRRHPTLVLYLLLFVVVGIHSRYGCDLVYMCTSDNIYPAVASQAWALKLIHCHPNHHLSALQSFNIPFEASKYCCRRKDNKEVVYDLGLSVSLVYPVQHFDPSVLTTCPPMPPRSSHHSRTLRLTATCRGFRL